MHENLFVQKAKILQKMWLLAMEKKLEPGAFFASIHRPGPKLNDQCLLKSFWLEHPDLVAINFFEFLFFCRFPSSYQEFWEWRRVSCVSSVICSVLLKPEINLKRSTCFTASAHWFRALYPSLSDHRSVNGRPSHSVLLVALLLTSVGPPKPLHLSFFTKYVSRCSYLLLIQVFNHPTAPGACATFPRVHL